MANESLIKTGTSIILADTTDHAPAAGNNLGTRTDQIDLTSTIAGGYKQSTKFNLGATRAAMWAVTGAFEYSVAPTAGGTVKVWIGFSHSATAGTGNPGNLAGADGDYYGYGVAAGDADEAINQLIFIGSIPVSNDADIHIGHLGVFIPEQQYGMIVVQNDASQAFIADAVEMSVRLTPVTDEIQ